MIRVSRTLLPLVVVIALGLLGCSGGDRPTLDNTEWRLIRWPVTSVDPTAFQITAKFAGGVCSGHSGVNTYSGSYQAGPGEKFLAVPAAVTLMAGPDNATDAEGAYLSRLSRASKHRFVDGNLVLFDPAGFESLVYEKVGG